MEQIIDSVEAKPSEVLAGLYYNAVEKIATYKRSGLVALVEGDTSAQEAAYQALRLLKEHDAGVRWTCEDEDGNQYTGNGAFWWQVVMLNSRVAGAANLVKKGLTAHLKGAGAAAQIG